MCKYLFRTLLSILLHIYPEEIAGSMVVLLFFFLRNFHTIFHSGCTILQAHYWCKSVLLEIQIRSITFLLKSFVGFPFFSGWGSQSFPRPPGPCVVWPPLPFLSHIVLTPPAPETVRCKTHQAFFQLRAFHGCSSFHLECCLHSSLHGNSPILQDSPFTSSL